MHKGADVHVVYSISQCKCSIGYCTEWLVIEKMVMDCTYVQNMWMADVHSGAFQDNGVL